MPDLGSLTNQAFDDRANFNGADIASSISDLDLKPKSGSFPSEFQNHSANGLDNDDKHAAKVSTESIDSCQRET